jgi:hypothetical protein
MVDLGYGIVSSTLVVVFCHEHRVAKSGPFRAVLQPVYLLQLRAHPNGFPIVANLSLIAATYAGTAT